MRISFLSTHPVSNTVSLHAYLTNHTRRGQAFMYCPLGLQLSYFKTLLIFHMHMLLRV